MRSFRERTRFATLLAVGLALVGSGVVAGAAGGNFILGQANSAGTSNTSLTTSSTGNALLVTQNGTGTAIRGSTGSGSGIAGFFTSGSGSGVSGVVGNQNSYGVYAANDSANEGSGAALRVNGKQNEGIIATSDDTNAVRGLVTGCDGGLGLCGGNGVQGQGYFLGAGVYGDGTDSIAGVMATEGISAAVYATSAATDIPAVYADSADGTGVTAFGRLGGDQSNLTDAGGAFMGANGVYGQTDTGFGAGVYGLANGGLNYAVFADGNAYVTGNFGVGGTCTGCTAALVAVNGSSSSLQQGDAVALEGVTQAKDGSVVLVVRAAKKNDTVIGVVQRALKAAPDSLKVTGGKRSIKVNGEGDQDVAAASGTAKALAGVWEEGGASVPADSYLRVITGGVFAFDGAAPADAEVGDAVAVGEKAGKLGKAGADASAKAGRFLGTLKDGSVVLMVDPS